MVQQVTTQSWGSRMIGSFFGVLIGIALIIGSFILIFWNEGSGLHVAQALEQTEKVLISVQNTPVDPQNDRKVVYFTGLATTNDELKDSVFGVSTKAIRLERKVEMYQWQQHEETTTGKQIGGSEKEVKTYTYKPVWSETIIDSSEFKEPVGHKNPTTMPFKSVRQQAQNVTVGDYKLPDELIDKIDGNKIVDLSTFNISGIKAKTNRMVQYDVDGLYVGEDASDPKIGDLHITITEVLPQNVSVIAQQIGAALQPFQAASDKPVALLVMGMQSAEQMIHEAKVQNQIVMWILRLVSLLMMVFGFMLILWPLSVLADVIPFMGSIVAFGTGVIAFVAGLTLWTFAMAIAWFAVRPLWALGLIVTSIAVCVFVLRRKRPVKSKK